MFSPISGIVSAGVQEVNVEYADGQSSLIVSALEEMLTTVDIHGL